MSKDLSIIIPVFNANKYLSKALKVYVNKLTKKIEIELRLSLLTITQKMTQKICLNFKKDLTL